MRENIANLKQSEVSADWGSLAFVIEVTAEWKYVETAAIGEHSRKRQAGLSDSSLVELWHDQYVTAMHSNPLPWCVRGECYLDTWKKSEVADYYNCAIDLLLTVASLLAPLDHPIDESEDFSLMQSKCKSGASLSSMRVRA